MRQGRLGRAPQGEGPLGGAGAAAGQLPVGQSGPLGGVEERFGGGGQVVGQPGGGPVEERLGRLGEQRGHVEGAPGAGGHEMVGQDGDEFVV